MLLHNLLGALARILPGIYSACNGASVHPNTPKKHCYMSHIMDSFGRIQRSAFGIGKEPRKERFLTPWLSQPPRLSVLSPLSTRAASRSTSSMANEYKAVRLKHMQRKHMQPPKSEPYFWKRKYEQLKKNYCQSKTSTLRSAHVAGESEYVPQSEASNLS